MGVALSRAQNGAQLQLEREVREKEEQLWDYEEALTKGIFRNKTGLVADMKGSVGPELIGWSHHGGPNQRFAIKDECFIHTQVDDKVWDVESGNLSPGAPRSSGRSTVAPTSSSSSGGRRPDKGQIKAR